MADVLDVVNDYTLVAVVDGTIGVFGGVDFVPEAKVRASLRLIDLRGKEHKPLPQSALSADASNMLAMMRPMMAANLGPMGENLNFYAFPAVDADGARLADATVEGRIAVKTARESYSFRLPLGALLRPKVCPKDDERMNGAWSFCPWHGLRLERDE